MFLFHVRYRKNLLTGDSIRREGAMLRVRFTGPAWQEGLDNARCTFTLPSAPTEPRPPNVDGRKDDQRRHRRRRRRHVHLSGEACPDHDEVELIRPHVARGEAVRGRCASIPAPSAKSTIPGCARRTPAFARDRACRESSGLRERGGRHRWSCSRSSRLQSATGEASRGADGPPAPAPPDRYDAPYLVVWVRRWRAGVALQLHSDDPWWGTLLVLLAMALTWYLPAGVEPHPRGPGRWLPLADAEAFARRDRAEDAWLDASTRGGRVVFALLAALAAALTYAVSRVSTYAAYIVAFDAAVLFPLFGTGRVRELPGHPVSGPGPTARESREGSASFRKLAPSRGDACPKGATSSTSFVCSAPPRSRSGVSPGSRWAWSRSAGSAADPSARGAGARHRRSPATRLSRAHARIAMGSWTPRR